MPDLMNRKTNLLKRAKALGLKVGAHNSLNELREMLGLAVCGRKSRATTGEGNVFQIGQRTKPAIRSKA